MPNERHHDAHHDAHQDARNPRNARSEAHDPGAYIGHEPEFEAETIPGGIGPKDERISALDTQSTGVGAQDKRETDRDTPPEGHREGSKASDTRRAGAGG
jgi:hypothetical protein